MKQQEKVRQLVLGRRGLVPYVMKILRSIPEEHRAELGRLCTETKNELSITLDHINVLEDGRGEEGCGDSCACKQ